MYFDTWSQFGATWASETGLPFTEPSELRSIVRPVAAPASDISAAEEEIVFGRKSIWSQGRWSFG
jgi:hypothetical protein